MEVKEIKFEGYGKISLHNKLWLPDNKPSAIVQIVHGMTEHIGRYEKLASILCENNIAVVGYDLRGHGLNNTESDCASFGSQGWDKSLEDMQLFYKLVHNMYPETPYFMLGFSLGSFLLRDYLTMYGNELAGAIIVGTGDQPSFILSILLKVINKEIKKSGYDGYTPTIDKMAFDNYNSKIKDAKTDFDWLCSDTKELDKYIKDDLCKRHISSSLFYQLVNSMKNNWNKSVYTSWNKELPILIISGQKDPVGEMGKGVNHFKEALSKAGINNVEVLLLEGARHDVLHEEKIGSAARARGTILNWVNRHVYISSNIRA